METTNTIDMIGPFRRDVRFGCRENPDELLLPLNWLVVMIVIIFTQDAIFSCPGVGKNEILWGKIAQQ